RAIINKGNKPTSTRRSRNWSRTPNIRMNNCKRHRTFIHTQREGNSMAFCQFTNITLKIKI
ncbi:unnamed protein product, partial [Prunus brigantina]